MVIKQKTLYGTCRVWWFTFGYDHKHPFTGESLRNCYVEVTGDVEETRIKMNEVFGNNWAFQYPENDPAVTKYNLRRVPWFDHVSYTFGTLLPPTHKEREAHYWPLEAITVPDGTDSQDIEGSHTITPHIPTITELVILVRKYKIPVTATLQHSEADNCLVVQW